LRTGEVGRDENKQITRPTGSGVGYAEIVLNWDISTWAHITTSQIEYSQVFP